MRNSLKLAGLAGCLLASALIDGSTMVPESQPESQTAPVCWEDEVVVEVVHDPYGLVGLGVLGCVAGDNLPTTGFRPDGHDSHTWDSQTDQIIHDQDN